MAYGMGIPFNFNSNFNRFSQSGGHHSRVSSWTIHPNSLWDGGYPFKAPAPSNGISVPFYANFTIQSSLLWLALIGIQLLTYWLKFSLRASGHPQVEISFLDDHANLVAIISISKSSPPD
jgi:hypothetical protein